jgi:hypothetical protein
MAIGAQAAPPHGYRQTPIWLLWGAYGRLIGYWVAPGIVSLLGVAQVVICFVLS